MESNPEEDGCVLNNFQNTNLVLYGRVSHMSCHVFSEKLSQAFHLFCIRIERILYAKGIIRGSNIAKFVLQV